VKMPHKEPLTFRTITWSKVKRKVIGNFAEMFHADGTKTIIFD
jgi:hypothetical protein